MRPTAGDDVKVEWGCADKCGQAWETMTVCFSIGAGAGAGAGWERQKAKKQVKKNKPQKMCLPLKSVEHPPATYLSGSYSTGNIPVTSCPVADKAKPPTNSGVNQHPPSTLTNLQHFIQVITHPQPWFKPLNWRVGPATTRKKRGVGEKGNGNPPGSLGRSWVYSGGVGEKRSRTVCSILLGDA